MADKNDHPSLDDPNAYVMYRYIPSQIAAIIFVAAFGLAMLGHIFQLVRKKTWCFIPLVVGCVFEAVGFLGRFISHNDVWAVVPFAMQSLLILVAPALFAASIYIILGRIILLVDGERYALVRQKWLTKTFVTGDVISFWIQSAGGGIQSAKTVSSLHTGEKVIIVGLLVQLIFFAFFIVVAGNFHYRLVNNRPVQKRFSPRSLFRKSSKRHQLTTSSSSTAPIQAPISRADIDQLPWKRHLYNLYFTSALIMVRSIFRVVEYIDGNAGYLLRHEIFLYVFDAVLMLIVVVVFIWIHPSEVTEALAKRQTDSPDVELEQTSEGTSEQGYKLLGRSKKAIFGMWPGGRIPSRN